MDRNLSCLEVLADPQYLQQVLARHIFHCPCEAVDILCCPPVCPDPERVLPLDLQEVGYLLKDLRNPTVFY